MKFRKILACLAALLLLAAPSSHPAASPQDDYLQIYVMINEGDKLDNSGQKSQAREKYENALNKLDKLKNENPEWEPTIVKYRIKYLNDKLSNLKSAKDTSPTPVEKPATPAAEKPATTTPPAPSAPAPAPTPSETPTPAIQKSEAPAPAVTSDDPSALRQKIIALTGDLESTRTELKQAKNDLEQALTEKKQLKEKLSASPAPDANVAKLQEENAGLRQKLTATEESLKKAAGGELSGEMTSLRGQVDSLEKKLAEANARSAELTRATDDYKKQIASLTTQLQATGSAGKSDSTLAKENAMLRSILDRQLKEQARREAARRLVLDEFKNLAVSTEALKTQMEVLSSPLVSLSNEEQDMLKFSAPSLVTPAPAAPAAPATSSSTSNTPTLSKDAEKPSSPESFSEKPRIPDEFKDVAAKATSLYNEKKFDEAATAYEQILAKYPQSIYALSNLGVVRFQQQKYPEAEKPLREAIRVAPNDAFSHSVLGIVLVQQEKYDDAIQVLSRAVALDPNDAKTRNYLGISSSRKGLQEAAEQECRKAIELDDSYGDAHFNLAVIYATQTPPSKELAKRHYNRALELGVPKDAELEKLLN
ncbi:MAG: tetratricopeptide repeat protein [Verrucomicrobia bacterium]|nr:tetratricopeptide repeat protein [Verrucomicrobiota bacterium]